MKENKQRDDPGPRTLQLEGVTIVTSLNDGDLAMKLLGWVDERFGAMSRCLQAAEHDDEDPRTGSQPS